MTFFGVTASDEIMDLGEPEELSLSYDRDAPADLLRVKFPVSSLWPEFREVRLLENGKSFFRGIVDEQNTTLSSAGLHTELICRSLEALLLDNEAQPEIIRNPSLAALEEKLLMPVGLTLGAGDRERKRGELTVNKGDSCWTVLSAFCGSFLGTVPYVLETGAVQCEAPEVKRINPSQIISAQIHYKPCKVISQVWKQSSRGSYDTLYQGSKSSVCRRRYVSMESGRDPRNVISEGEQNSFLLTVTCRGAFWNLRNALVTVHVPGAGKFTDCPVQRAVYQRNKNGEQTRLVLERGKEEALCG